MIKVVSNELMRASDEAAIKKYTGKELLKRAGTAIFNYVDWKGNIAIVCGTGNNGGDGYVLAELLYDHGFNVTIVQLKAKYTDDSSFYFQNCQKKHVKIMQIGEVNNLDDFDMIVDCLVGTGFKAIPNVELRNAINLINESKAYKISIDINSGLNGNSGKGEKIVKSDLTISLGNYKSGLFLNQASDYIKQKVNLDIGIELVDEPYYLLENSDVLPFFEKRQHCTNKSNYGYVALIGGSLNYSGAIKLSNLAVSALRSGAGVVKLCSLDNLATAIMPYLLESTFTPLKTQNSQYVFDEQILQTICEKTKTIAIGMGMGTSGEVYKTIKYLLQNFDGNLIIDADGLNSLSQGDMNILLNAKAQVIITPHMMEFSRLTKISLEEIQVDPILTAKEFALKYHLIVLLKGTTTIITDGIHTYLTDKGTPGMATAGSGDVLSGILCGMCTKKDNLLMQVASGAYLNGFAGELAAEEFTDIAMIASDTVKMIPKAIKKIRNN